MSDIDENHVALALIADALFCSGLENGAAPTGPELVSAIRTALQMRRGWNGCTRAVAAAFAKAPTAAAEREMWSHRLAEQALKTAEVQALLISRMEEQGLTPPSA